MSGLIGGRPGPVKSAAGVWAGNVTKVVDGRPYVELKRYAPGHEFGPLQYVVSPGATPDPWVVGDRVLVSFLEGRGDAPVVLGRLV